MENYSEAVDDARNAYRYADTLPRSTTASSQVQQICIWPPRSKENHNHEAQQRDDAQWEA